MGILRARQYEKSLLIRPMQQKCWEKVWDRFCPLSIPEIRGMIVYAFEGREEELLIHMELFLQIHSEIRRGEQPEEERLRKDVYWFMSDLCDVMAAYRVREQVDPSLSFARDIIMGADLSDPRYLYQFGEYISETELKDQHLF